MATRFKPLKLRNPDLFGVALSGSVGRRDHANLQDLADRAVADGKVNIVLDLTEVTSIGGGGVKILAGFQENLLNAGGEMVFVGASEVMREYLARNFNDLPQQHFDSTDVLCPGGSDSNKAMESEDRSEGEDKPAAAGAVSLQNVEETTDGLDGLLGQFKGSGGKRHHFVSLAEAVESLDFLAREDEHHRLTQALSDLLYGHDLAQSVELLTRQDDCLISTSGLISIPYDGGIMPQLLAVARPMTILDLDNDALSEDEINMLAEHGPDMLLPIVYQDELFAVLFLMNEGEERDYGVAETLALELLIQVVSESVVRQQQSLELPPVEEHEQIPKEILAEPQKLDSVDQVEKAATSETKKSTLAGSSGTTLESTLLCLAEDLPVADDSDHFWTLFANHTAVSLGVLRLAFMSPDDNQAHLYVGQADGCEDLSLDDDRFQVYLRSVERPVRVENLPHSFSGIASDLNMVHVQWIVSLNWENEFLGTVLLQLDRAVSTSNQEEYLTSVMDHIARHMAHFSDSNSQQDSNLEVVRILMGQREKRCFGSEEVTDAMARQVRMLAQEMGFPPAQERDLIYGCLLRDIGLVSQSDKFTVNPEKLGSEEQFAHRRHPVDGVLMLASLDVPQTIVDVVQGHHERFNGEGYPLGQTGREIPLAARVVSVVEHYVFMLTGVGGVDSLNPDEAAEQLRLDEEGRFDPEIVKIFLDAVQRPAAASEEVEVQETVPASPSLSVV